MPQTPALPSPPPPPSAPASVGHGLGRFLGFSDAVVAIAATLLVLPLVDVVRAGGDAGLRELGSADNRGTLLGFVLSFLVIYRFWGVHHDTFRMASTLTRALRWLNGLWLLSIAFLPVPTRLIGVAESRGADGLYIGTMLVLSLTAAATDWLVTRVTPWQVLTIPAALAVALALAVAVPAVGLWALLLLLPVGIVQRRFLRPRKQ